MARFPPFAPPYRLGVIPSGVPRLRISALHLGGAGPSSPAQSGLGFDRLSDPLPRFWQLRFHAFNVWSHKKKIEKLDYMHNNPVKRRLVRDPKDWPWSSYSFYSGRGVALLAINSD